MVGGIVFGRSRLILLGASLLVFYALLAICENLATSSSMHSISIADVLRKKSSKSTSESGLLSVRHVDEPLALKLFLPQYNNTVASVVIASAIPQDDKVAFIVIEEGIKIPGFKGSYQALPTLPPGLGCLFSDDNSVDSNTTKAKNFTSDIQPYAITQCYYNSSSIWMCDMPEPVKDSRRVTITLPYWAKRVSGHGRFSLNKERKYQQMGTVNSCHQNIYNIDNHKIQEVNEYLDYYEKLGVAHFTFYVEQGRGENISFITESLKARQTKSITTLFLIPGSLRKLSPRIKRHPDAASFTANDCLWRSRAANMSWTMMQVDLDEFLVGTDHLPTFLSNWSPPALYVKQYVVKFPHDFPRVYPHKAAEHFAAPTSNLGQDNFQDKSS